MNKNGLELQYVSDELKDNYDIVYTAVCNKGKSLKYASDKLKQNKQIILKAIDN